MPAIGELMAEHQELLTEADAVRAALRSEDRAGAHLALRRMTKHLHTHVRREEVGIFTALAADDDLADEIRDLEGEHRDLDAAIDALDPTAPGFATAVKNLLRDLTGHIEREDFGIFPVSVVSLGSAGWDIVEQARVEHPTFLGRRQAVAEAMIHSPKTLPADVSISTVRHAFEDDHVHMVLLTEDDRLVGTLVRGDLDDAPDRAPALPRGTLEHRTISPLATTEEALRTLAQQSFRRLAVVDDADGARLLGLLCLNQRRTGFCSDDDVAARQAGHARAHIPTT